MSEPLSASQARSEVSRLFVYGRTPDPDAEAAARARLACANLDRDIRRGLSVSPWLDDAQVGHLVGLLLNSCGVDGDSCSRLETDVRTAVRLSQAARPELAEARRRAVLVSLQQDAE